MEGKRKNYKYKGEKEGKVWENVVIGGQAKGGIENHRKLKLTSQ